MFVGKQGAMMGRRITHRCRWIANTQAACGVSARLFVISSGGDHINTQDTQEALDTDMQEPQFNFNGLTQRR